MFFLSSLFIMFALLFAVTVIGISASNILPYRMRPVGRLFFSPLLGLAVLILVTTLHGWIAPFKQIACIAEGLILVVPSFYFIRRAPNLLSYLLTILVFSIIASLTVFAPLIRFEGFNPFNDAFTYLVHGQWLQKHPFSEAVSGSGFYPALTQVALYQGAGSRMGGSFFLGWVQAAFGLKWSYFAYPSVLAVPLIAGSLAIGGAVSFVERGSRKIAFLTSAAAATMLNGFTFGATLGFFPQTFGLAFATGSMALFSGLTIESRRIQQFGKLFVSSIPVSLCFAALIFCYNDILPFFVVAMIGFLFLIIIYRQVGIKKLLLLNTIIFSQTVIIINLEFLRVLRNVRILLGVGSGSAPIGWPVLWSPFEFLAFSFGFKSAFNFWLVGKTLAVLLFIVCLLMILYYIFLNIKEKLSTALLIYICVLLVFLCAFVYFRYFVSPATTQEVGQTFLQFKISKWSSPFYFVLMGSCFAFFSKRHNFLNRVLPVFLICIIGISITKNYSKVSKNVIQDFLNETGYTHSPFSALLHLRELVRDIDPNNVIYLDLSSHHHKLRQMAAYVLSDRRLASDYTDDGYITGHLPPEQRMMPFKMSDWGIEYVKQDEKYNYPRAGNLILRKPGDYIVTLASVKEGYGLESDSMNWWHWTSKSLAFEFKVLRGDLKRARLKFTYMPASPGRLVKIIVTGKGVNELSIVMKGGWHEYISAPIDIESHTISIRFISDEGPIRVSNNDPRMMSFLIKNLEVIKEQ